MATVLLVPTSPRCPLAGFPRMFWGVLAWCLFLTGCGTAPLEIVPALPLAHLSVINQTDYTWHIVIVRPSGPSVYDSQSLPRATSTVDLPAGSYVIEQTALAENAPAGLTRKIPTKLEAGQTYRWRLVTLLSEPAGNEGAK